MAMGEKEKKQAIGAALALPILVVVLYGFAPASWLPFFSHQNKVVEMTGLQVRIDSLTIEVDKARKDLAQGSLESLRQRVEDFQRAVGLMRRLVPEAQEIPNLIDDVSSKAKIRGLQIVQLTPLGLDDGAPFQTDRYRLSIAGHYDQIGEFLADVASLPRIMVPYDVTVNLASADRIRQNRDTTNSLLEVGFQLRTFVKPASAPGDTTGAGGAL